MSRRDRLTYDLGEPPPTQGRSAWVLVVAVAALAATTLGVVLIVNTRAGDRSANEVTQAAVSPAATPARSSAAAAPTTPAPSGSDAREGLTAPAGSARATTIFVRAWLDRQPATRRSALTAVASPALTEALLITDPAEVPRATPRGAPALVSASPHSASFTQALSSGQEIAMDLAADPSAPYGWLVTSVDQA